MHTKTASLALLALTIASKAVPLALNKQGYRVLSSSRMEDDCANAAGKAGLPADAINLPCIIPSPSEKRSPAEDTEDSTVSEQSSPSSAEGTTHFSEHHEESVVTDHPMLSQDSSSSQRADSSPTSSGVPTVSDAQNSQVPPHLPPPAGNATTAGDVKHYKWLGSSIFRILGGLF